jgi:enoyl-CoA hydratase/carnithine racemase
MAEFVDIRREGAVAVIGINRPQRRNALNLQLKRELIDALQQTLDDAAIAVIVLTGHGGYFVAGTDIAEMAQMRPLDHLRQGSEELFRSVRQASKPVIAAVEGYALGGGCELALACDLIVAAEDARFGQPEIKVGIMPGAGGTQRMLRAAGRYKALLWALTGEMIPAREAYAANLVSALAPPGEALAQAVALAGHIATMPPLAVQAIRDAIRLGADVPLETALSLERRLFERLFDSDDQKEGMHAFIDKRPARFQGR